MGFVQLLFIDCKMCPFLILLVLLSFKSDVRAEDSFNDFEQAALEAHNEYRSVHGLPPLILDRMMCDWAQSWAKFLATHNIWAHRPNNLYAENLYSYSDLQADIVPSIDQVVKTWYDEINLYDYNNPRFHRKKGHFTGLLFKGSLEFGIAKATNNRTAKMFIVANYNTPGHWNKKYC